MAGISGSWTHAPGGGVIACFYGVDPTVDCGDLELYIHADTRSEAVRRAKRLGMHGGALKSRGVRISDDDVNALLSSGTDVLWRRDTDEPGCWRSLDEWPPGRK